MMRTYRGKDLPTLLDKQYSLIHVDMRTGKILDAEGKRPCDVTKEDWVLIFDSLEEAEAYASEKVAQQGGLQCSIFDSQTQWVKHVANSMSGDRPKPRQPWWKFWRR